MVDSSRVKLSNNDLSSDPLLGGGAGEGFGTGLLDTADGGPSGFVPLSIFLDIFLKIHIKMPNYASIEDR